MKIMMKCTDQVDPVTNTVRLRTQHADIAGRQFSDTPTSTIHRPSETCSFPRSFSLSLLFRLNRQTSFFLLLPLLECRRPGGEVLVGFGEHLLQKRSADRRWSGRSRWADGLGGGRGACSRSDSERLENQLMAHVKAARPKVALTGWGLVAVLSATLSSGLRLVKRSSPSTTPLSRAGGMTAIVLGWTDPSWAVLTELEGEEELSLVEAEAEDSSSWTAADEVEMAMCSSAD